MIDDYTVATEKNFEKAVNSVVEARIQTETGAEYALQSDETIALGGGGSAPNPVQCCVYGLIACYAATFAKWAAMDGIIFRSFKIKATANVDLTLSYGISDNPIPDSLKWKMIVDTDASMEELERLNEIHTSSVKPTIPP